MILSVQASYSTNRTYVLKLHRDCEPAAGELIGCLEHVASARTFHFNSIAELLAFLARDVAEMESASEGDEP